MFSRKPNKNTKDTGLTVDRGGEGSLLYVSVVCAPSVWDILLVAIDDQRGC